MTLKLVGRAVFASIVGAFLACSSCLSEGKESKSEPGDWNSRGARLFSGREPFQNGGKACMECHTLEGRMFMSSLSKIARKKQGNELVSFLQHPGNLIMRKTYQKHPLTKEEIAALSDYLASVRESSHLESGAKDK